jgi:hypothetical protein
MALTIKKVAIGQMTSSAHLDPIKSIEDEQNRLRDLMRPYHIDSIDIATGVAAGIDRILTPSMIIGHSTDALMQLNGMHYEITSREPAAHKRRTAALKSVFGIWKDRKDAPQDGLDYQQEMRAEWR